MSQASEAKLISLSDYCNRRAQQHMVVMCEPNIEKDRVKLSWSPKLSEANRDRINKAIRGFQDACDERQSIQRGVCGVDRIP